MILLDAIKRHSKNYIQKEGTYLAVLYSILKFLELVEDKTYFC